MKVPKTVMSKDELANAVAEVDVGMRFLANGPVKSAWSAIKDHLVATVGVNGELVASATKKVDVGGGVMAVPEGTDVVENYKEKTSPEELLRQGRLAEARDKFGTQPPVLAHAPATLDKTPPTKVLADMPPSQNPGPAPGEKVTLPGTTIDRKDVPSVEPQLEGQSPNPSKGPEAPKVATPEKAPVTGGPLGAAGNPSLKGGVKASPSGAPVTPANTVTSKDTK